MSKTKRPPFEGLYIYIFLVLLAFVLADLAVIRMQMYLEGQKSPAAGAGTTMKMAGGPSQRTHTPPDKYRIIPDRNLFNADGLIPPPIGAGEGGLEVDNESGPVKTDLPIQLLGTIVHANPYRSIASMLLQGESEPDAVKVGDPLKDLAEVLGIFRRRVVFRNLKNQRLEYIEIPEDQIIAERSKAPKMPVMNAGGPKIDRKGNEFTVNRMDVKNQLDDYMSLARTARAVPHIDPRTGEMTGFKITRMAPGSLFQTLGLQPGDVVTGVNGENISSANKALEIFGMLKNQVDSVDKVSISIQRNGSNQELSYNVSD